RPGVPTPPRGALEVARCHPAGGTGAAEHPKGRHPAAPAVRQAVLPWVAEGLNRDRQPPAVVLVRPRAACDRRSANVVAGGAAGGATTGHGHLSDGPLAVARGPRPVEATGRDVVVHGARGDARFPAPVFDRTPR